MTTSDENPLDVEGILKEVWVHFKKFVPMGYSDGAGKPTIDVPMAALTAAQAREIAQKLIVYAEHAEEHAVEWKCRLWGCPIRIHTKEGVDAPTCLRHADAMIRV
jgi:hypothetical protein